MEICQQGQEKAPGQLGIRRNGNENWDITSSTGALSFSHGSYSLGLFLPLYNSVYGTITWRTCENADCGAPLQSGQISRSEEGPENLHFAPVPRQCCCCQSGHQLREPLLSTSQCLGQEDGHQSCYTSRSRL